MVVDMHYLLKLNPVSDGTLIGETFQRLFGSGSQVRIATSTPYRKMPSPSDSSSRRTLFHLTYYIAISDTIIF